MYIKGEWINKLWYLCKKLLPYKPTHKWIYEVVCLVKEDRYKKNTYHINSIYEAQEYAKLKKKKE